MLQVVGERRMCRGSRQPLTFLLLHHLSPCAADDRFARCDQALPCPGPSRALTHQATSLYALRTSLDGRTSVDSPTGL